MRSIVWTGLILLALSCSTPSSVAPLAVPLQYKMMASPNEFPTMPACAAVSDVRVTDARSDMTLGKRFVEGKTSAAAPVTASNDVAAWAKTGVLEALKRGGVQTEKAGAPVLRISIDQINTTENVLHRSGYEGSITIAAELGRRGAACWKDRADGSSENYGYSGSVENYQETLNHALDRAMIRLMNSSDFKKSICSCQ